MADIIQAAKWVKEGHTVQRSGARFWLTGGVPWWYFIPVCADGGEHNLDGTDLLADDWEIAT